MGLKKLLKKVSKPLTTVATGGLNLAYKALKDPKMPNMDYGDPNTFGALGAEEMGRRQALAGEQQKQILDFGNDFERNARDYRGKLADSLAQTGQQTFQRANPFILEDLQSRGLASSPSEVANQQSQALKDIALQNQNTLSGFDTDTFGQLNDIRGSALSQFLGGNQDALDSALEARRMGLQRNFDMADMNNQNAMAKYAGKRQSRDALLGSLIGFGGKFATGGLG